MKIAVYINAFEGGIKRRMIEMLRELLTHHDISAYVLMHKKIDYVELKDLSMPVYFYSYYQWTCSWSNYINAIFNISNAFFSIKTQKKIASDINGSNYDIAFVNQCIMTICPIVIRYIKIPKLYYADALFRRFYETIDPTLITLKIPCSFIEDQFIKFVNYAANKLPFLMLKIIDKRVIKKSSAVACNSIFLKKTIKSIYNIDCIYSPHGVNTSDFRNINISRKGVLTVGGMVWSKGFGFIIRSLAAIDENIRPRLTIIYGEVRGGMNSYKSRLIEFARELDVSVKFAGPVKDVSQMNLYYNQAQAMLFAPIDEAFGLVVLEAMASETPVVAVNEGGPAEIIQDRVTGRLVQRDFGLFASVVEEYLLDDDLRCRHGRNARDCVVNNWSWGSSRKALEAVFNKTILGEKEK